MRDIKLPNCPPLLLLDVDGVISLFGFDTRSPPPGRFEMVDGIGHFLSASAGEHLRRLSRWFELVWCTGWEEKANDYLPLALDLEGPLPHLVFDRASGSSGDHWKLSAIDAFAGAERALAWVDDGHDSSAREWARRRPGPTLLVSTDPAVGLADTHVERLINWAERAR